MKRLKIVVATKDGSKPRVCKFCGTPLIEGVEMVNGMCNRCPEFCYTCQDVLAWNRIVCTHKMDDGELVNFSYCRPCGIQHMEKHDDS